MYVWGSDCCSLSGFCLGKLKGTGICILLRGQPSPFRPRQGGSSHHPHLCVLIWENPGSLCQEPSQPVKKIWSCGYPMNDLLVRFSKLCFTGMTKEWASVTLLDFEDSDSGFGRPVCIRMMGESPVLSWRLYCWRWTFRVPSFVCVYIRMIVREIYYWLEIYYLHEESFYRTFFLFALFFFLF